MSMTADNPGTGVDIHAGTPAYCTQCEAPLVVYESRAHGYAIVCGCGTHSVSINAVAAESSLFEPISGQWSNVDEINPWDSISLTHNTDE